MTDMARLQRDQKTLSRVHAFLDEISCGEGLTDSQVDILYGIAHHREDLPLTPHESKEPDDGS